MFHGEMSLISAHTFATLIVNGQNPGNATANVPALGHISAFKADVFHQLIQNTCIVLGCEVPIQWRARGERVTGQRRNNQVIRQSTG